MFGAAARAVRVRSKCENKGCVSAKERLCVLEWVLVAAGHGSVQGRETLHVQRFTQIAVSDDRVLF